MTFLAQTRHGAESYTAIDGVELFDLKAAADARGFLAPVYAENRAPFALAQWNLVKSVPGALRGFHAHAAYDEIYVALEGRIWIGLKDIRPGSASFGVSLVVWLEPCAGGLVVPAGVGHAACSPEGSLMLAGLSTLWTGADEFGCRWNDPALGLQAPVLSPIISPRDAQAGSFAALQAAVGLALTE